MTNYEKIMSETPVKKVAMVMAFWFDDCDDCPLEANDSCDCNKLCIDNLKDWLEREVENENEQINN